MIHVSKNQLSQVEYLIEQSMQGHHVLFDNDTLRKVFWCSNRPISDDEAYSVEHHIERLIEQPTLESKRAYLEQLDETTLDLVVRTYFNIVENNIFENVEVRH